jgi:hypothetical protein
VIVYATAEVGLEDSSCSFLADIFASGRKSVTSF